MAIERIPLRDAAVSLGPVQHGHPVTASQTPVAVRAWVHTRRGHELVDGRAEAWTPKAVRVRYLDAHGREGVVWVWASAVRRR